MTIHVNIGEAKTRLSELVAASERGEEVVIARAGKPAVKLVPADGRLSIVEARRQAFGAWKGLADETIDWEAPAFTEEEWEAILAEEDHYYLPEKEGDQPDNEASA